MLSVLLLFFLHCLFAFENFLLVTRFLSWDWVRSLPFYSTFDIHRHRKDRTMPLLEGYTMLKFIQHLIYGGSRENYHDAFCGGYTMLIYILHLTYGRSRDDCHDNFDGGYTMVIFILHLTYGGSREYYHDAFDGGYTMVIFILHFTYRGSREDCHDDFDGGYTMVIFILHFTYGGSREDYHYALGWRTWEYRLLQEHESGHCQHHAWNDNIYKAKKLWKGC